MTEINCSVVTCSEFGLLLCSLSTRAHHGPYRVCRGRLAGLCIASAHFGSLRSFSSRGAGVALQLQIDTAPWTQKPNGQTVKELTVSPSIMAHKSIALLDGFQDAFSAQKLVGALPLQHSSAQARSKVVLRQRCV